MRRSVGGGGNNGGNAAGRQLRRVPVTIDRTPKLSISRGTASAGRPARFGAQNYRKRHRNHGHGLLAAIDGEKFRFCQFLRIPRHKNRTTIDGDSVGQVGVGENR